MSTRTSLVALAAITAFAMSALAPTAASARGFGGGGHIGGHIGGIHVGGHIGIHGGFHGRIGGVLRAGGFLPGRFCDWRCRGHYPVWPGVVGGTTVATSVAAPVVSTPAPTGNCLTKRELNDGSALFKDRCTGEEAESQPK
jgi:hypothetical protein